MKEKMNLVEKTVFLYHNLKLKNIFKTHMHKLKNLVYNITGERSFLLYMDNQTVPSFISSWKLSMSFPSDYRIPQFSTFCRKEVSLFFGSYCLFSLNLYLPLNLKQECQVTLKNHQREPGWERWLFNSVNPY